MKLHDLEVKNVHSLFSQTVTTASQRLWLIILANLPNNNQGQCFLIFFLLRGL